MAAPNKRFGVMRGVCSQKVLWEFESFVARPNFCVPPPERQAANRWRSCGDIRAKTVLEKSLTDCPLEVRLTAEVRN